VTSLVFLDFGGTIDADGDRWSVRFYRAYRAAGGQRRFDDYEPSFRKSDLLLAEQPDILTMGWREMAATQAAVVARLLREPDGPDPRAVADAFVAGTERIIDRNRPILEELAASHTLGVISNFTGNLGPVLQDLGLRPLFVVVADSAIVGASKPDLELFRWARERAPKSESIWMVGDNFDADIRPAAALGWATCWLAPAGRAAPAGGLATTRISRLEQLPGALAECTV
jgi:putative hydrolase of the HAD superfamily